MKTQAICVLLGAAFCAGASAQTSVPSRQTSVYERVRALATQSEARFTVMESGNKQAEADRQYEFARDAIEFVTSWNKFVESYNGGKLDLARARELSKEFRELEKRGGWLGKDKGREKNAIVNACPAER